MNILKAKVKKTEHGISVKDLEIIVDLALKHPQIEELILFGSWKKKRCSPIFLMSYFMKIH
jgi:hypothetical protein